MNCFSMLDKSHMSPESTGRVQSSLAPGQPMIREAKVRRLLQLLYDENPENLPTDDTDDFIISSFTLA